MVLIMCIDIVKLEISIRILILNDIYIYIYRRYLEVQPTKYLVLFTICSFYTLEIETSKCFFATTTTTKKTPKTTKKRDLSLCFENGKLPNI